MRSRLSKYCEVYFSDLAASNLVHCEFEGFEDLASWKGSIICANHPSILDAICFFWKIPGIGCVVGTNPWSNPLLSLPARLADFVPRDPALRMLKECRQRLLRGENILLFKATTEPIKFRFSVGEIFRPGPAETARDLSRRLESYYRQNLGRDGDRIFRLPKTSQP